MMRRKTLHKARVTTQNVGMRQNYTGNVFRKLWGGIAKRPSDAFLDVT